VFCFPSVADTERTAVLHPTRGEPRGLLIGLAKKSAPISNNTDHWHMLILSAKKDGGKQQRRFSNPIFFTAPRFSVLAPSRERTKEKAPENGWFSGALEDRG
jgi:hypothetical protein